MDRNTQWFEERAKAHAHFIQFERRGDDVRNPLGQFASKGGGAVSFSVKHALLATSSVHAGMNKLYDKALMSYIFGMDKSEYSFTVDKDGNPRKIETSHTANHNVVNVYPGDQAIIHTHPKGVQPRPSPDDFTAAKEAGIPNYELSQKAIYVANPDGTSGKIADITFKHGVIQIDWLNEPAQ